MPSLPISIQKRMGEGLKAACRSICRPLTPYLPDAVANRLPFLGRVCVRGPAGVRLRFHTHGAGGKDRIALKLARRGLWGYEGETTRVFLALIENAHTVIDIGANTGLFALLAAKVKPECRVWAFEPVPFIFDMLQANQQLNQAHNLKVLPYAVSDFVGETPFYITRTNVGIPTDSSSCQGFRADVDELRLPTTTLDAFVQEAGIERVDLIKIDTEASESKVMRGALKTIAAHRPKIICEVLANVDHSFVQRTLLHLGYRFYHITPHCLHRHSHLQGSLEEWGRNYLFAPAEAEMPRLVAA